MPLRLTNIKNSVAVLLLLVFALICSLLIPSHQGSKAGQAELPSGESIQSSAPQPITTTRLVSKPAPPNPLPHIEYRILTPEEMGLSDEEARFCLTGPVDKEVLGRRIPDVTTLEEIQTDAWHRKTVSLVEANTLDNWYYQQRLFGVLEDGSVGRRIFVPQVVLLKLRDQKIVTALRVLEGRELEAIRLLEAHPLVQYAGLNSLQRRGYAPNDPMIGSQWHHAIMGSFDAWEIALGDTTVRVAIVDSPFQMAHADLIANVSPGWNAFANAPVTASDGIDHSTGAAGLVAAVINNGVGVAGIVNCQVLPIQINGTLAEMYIGTLWAATNNVRVVNISWTGAEDPIMNWAGMALRDGSRGVLAMIGGNGATRLDYTNHPLVVAISGTDAADNPASSTGPHIDFAAPGFPVFTTAVNSGYGLMAGTSFATPLFSAAVAMLFAINPALDTAEVIDILKSTAKDLGAPGWDEVFGWGRIDLAKAALAARQSLGTNQPPKINSIPAQWVFAGQTLSIGVQAEDADLPQQQLAYGLTEASPGGANIDASSGLFSWTPSLDQAGQSFTIHVTVTDNGTPPMGATNSFAVYVLANDYSIRASLAIADDGQNLRITWPTLAGLSYWVDYKSNLTALDWETIAQVAAKDGLGVFTKSNHLAGEQGYFRIRLPTQQP
jgi:hypothetical protein